MGASILIVAKQQILSVSAHVLNVDGAVDEIGQLVARGEGAYVCLLNVDQCMKAHDDADFACVVNAADRVLADGRPIYWVQRLRGHRDAGQVRGEDLLLTVCAHAAAQGWRVGFYGGDDEGLLRGLIGRLQAMHPALTVAYQHSPPFRPLSRTEDAQITDAINAASVDVLFIGIGCPKQERWMHAHRERLDCVMLGVGAAFDFVAGAKPAAPRWVQWIGLEWLLRLACEPGRLFPRYARANPRFVWHLIRQLSTQKKGVKAGTDVASVSGSVNGHVSRARSE